MNTENNRRPHHKKEQLKSNLSRLQASLKAMVKDERTFENKSKLSAKLGEELDLDPSLFRKADSEHRKVLNQYLQVLVPTTKAVIADVQMELKALRSKVTEKDQKIKVLKNILAERPPTQVISPPEKSTENYFFEYEATCMLIKDILDKNPNFKFINNELYDEATFSGQPEIISTSKRTNAYLRWELARTNTEKRLEQLDPEK
ncbi:hypothetical protein [Pseudomonas sp. C32]|jgi:hypothetical protein|uniref:hypothetical protein n=1 Tax=Pseudomonas sp. C32 TaxID=1529208 RepID=UPI0026346560|nr:hypothetical protein [Pseudomonas sp. C32]MDN4546998.1 hypothetical protein [Pseudomonas sp. C32]